MGIPASGGVNYFENSVLAGSYEQCIIYYAGRFSRPMDWLTTVALRVRKSPRLLAIVNKFAEFAHVVSPETILVLDYPIQLKQRWGAGGYHTILYESINQNRESYTRQLESFLSLAKYFALISETQPGSELEPYWNNGWMPALDGVALYSFIVALRPKVFMEVGSGNSTKFARRAIADHNLDTRIISIDPCPRAEIDSICDEVVRVPVEEVDISLFDQLGKNDILYIDNSHRVFMNSDANVVFLDVIPRLKPGVFVEIHDVTLPYDYPEQWIERYYSEQYLLAAYILSRGQLFDIVLPNAFISMDSELISILTPLWSMNEMANVEKHGSSFWLRMR